MKNRFSHDAVQNGGYLYTTRAPWSARTANQRLTTITASFLQQLPTSTTKVYDLGCGDGTYTAYLACRYPQLHFIGTDISPEAIAHAQRRYPQFHFFVSDLTLAPPRKITSSHKAAGLLRGVIHHVSHPAATLWTAQNYCQQLQIIEPNGNNPGVKIIERISGYHREHQERSFSTKQLVRWCKQAGWKVKSVTYVGLVPFFCPTWLAHLLKMLEPLAEKEPWNKWLCAQIIIEVHIS